VKSSIVGRQIGPTQEVAKKYGIARDDNAASGGAVAARRERRDSLHADAVARQAIQCMKAGKHVQVEIPLADSLEGRRGQSSSCSG
jgi:2-hydroxy-4-carboxymuconate semialdehyde hemiacetal dehydrogenase